MDGRSARDRSAFQTLMELPASIVFILQDTHFAEVSGGCEALTGYRREELLRMHVMELVHPDFRALVASRTAARLAGENPPPRYEFKIVRKDGGERWIDVASSRFDYRGRPALIDSAWDITDRKAAEAKLVQQGRLYRTLSEVNQLLVRATNQELILSEACRILAETGGYRLVWVRLKDEATGRVVPAFKAGPVLSYLDSVEVFWDKLRGCGPTGTCLREGRIVIVHNTQTDPIYAPWREAARSDGLLSVAAFPLPVRGRIIAAVSLYASEPNAFGSEEEALFSTLGRNLGYSLEVLNLRQECERNEGALRESEERFSAFMRHLPAVAVMRDREGRYVYMNDEWDKAMELRREDFLGKTPRECFPSKDALVLLEGDRLAFKTGKPSLSEIDLHHRVGTRHWLSIHFPIRDRQGHTILTGSVYADLTERKRAEEALAESEAAFRTLAESSRSAIFVYEGESFVYVNPEVERMTGYSARELIGQPVEILVHPEDRPMIRKNLTARIQGGPVPLRYDFRVITKGGEVRWAAFTAAACRFRGQNAVLCSAYDVTSRKRIEETLKESEAKHRRLWRTMRLMSDNVPDLIWAKDLDGQYLFANKAMCTILLQAKDTDEPIGKTDLFFAERERAAHPGCPDWHTFGQMCRDSDAVVLASRHPERFEEAGMVRGEPLILDVYKAPFWDADGVLIGTVGSGRVVTAEKQMAEERKRMEQLLRLREAALEAAANAIIITDAEGLIEWANPAFAQLTGYVLDEIFGKTPSFLKSGVQDEAFYREMWAAIRAGSVWRGELVNRRKDGTLYSDEMTITPVRFGTEAISHFIAVKQDITERKHLGEELIRAKHFETIGMIAGGVAHEVRNPLFAISTIIAALERKLSDRPEFGEYMTHIQDQTRRLNALMNDLLLLGRPVEDSSFVPVELGEVLRQSLDLASKSAFGECPCLLEPSLEPLRVMGTAEKLVQVFLNLMQNALSFTPVGGRAVVRAWREGEQAVVTVRDEGPGISAGLLPRLFQPFQTERKGGTGLGLAIVRHIVAAHGGTVEAFNNDPPPGATLTVRLPLEGGMETGEAGGA